MFVDGFDQSNDTDINSSRLAFSIITLSLTPFIISGNVLTIIIVCVFRKLQTIQNVLMASSAVNGLLYGLLFNPCYALFWLPRDIMQSDTLFKNEYTCITFLVPVVLSGSGTAFHIIMISGDRFFAIVYPLKYHMFMSLEQVMRALIVVWLACTVFIFLPYAVNDYQDGECSVHTTLLSYSRYWLFPIMVTCILSSTVFNICVWQTAQRFSRKDRQRSKSNALKRQQQRHMQYSRYTLSIAMYLKFMIIWFPYLISVLLKWKCPWSKAVLIYHTISAIFLNLHYLSEALLYALIKKEAREAFKLILTTPPWQWSGLRFHQLHCDLVQAPVLVMLPSTATSSGFATRITSESDVTLGQPEAQEVIDGTRENRLLRKYFEVWKNNTFPQQHKQSSLFDDIASLRSGVTRILKLT